MAATCVVLGLGIGYGLRSVEKSPSASVTSATAPSAAKRMPTLDDFKQMADRQAAPLLAKLKSDPNDSALLVQVAGIYHGSHQFKEAANYYDQAIKGDPKNVALRTKLASSLYRSGDVDGAIAQLKEGLRYDPKDANCLFNLGMILLQGKGDAEGAMAAWQRLLKSNPQLSADRKAEVQRLMADVMTTLASQRAAKGATGK
jgi:cytochrome c-type biogenesis protein CcmH/NrfG